MFKVKYVDSIMMHKCEVSETVSTTTLKVGHTLLRVSIPLPLIYPLEDW